MKNWQKFAAGGAVVVVALAGTRAVGLWGTS